jgi:hypothetical protein
MPLRFGVYVYGVSLAGTKISREWPGGYDISTFFAAMKPCMDYCLRKFAIPS